MNFGALCVYFYSPPQYFSIKPWWNNSPTGSMEFSLSSLAHRSHASGLDSCHREKQRARGGRAGHRRRGSRETNSNHLWILCDFCACVCVRERTNCLSTSHKKVWVYSTFPLWTMIWMKYMDYAHWGPCQTPDSANHFLFCSFSRP